MKTLIPELRRSVLLTLSLALLLCGAYPLLVTAFARLAYPDKADGSPVFDRKGILRGSLLLGQPFNAPGYFRSRPSAAGSGYDAANSSGTNLGPTSAKLHDSVRDAILAYRKENGLADDVLVPADAVTSSGSGLDPHISLANARLQASRVARERALGFDKVVAMIDACVEQRDLGVFGELRVNVVKLNARLDGLLP